MKLRKIFQSNTTRFKNAIAANDLEEIRTLEGKKDDWLVLVAINPSNYAGVTPEMAKLLLETVDNDVMKRWSALKDIDNAHEIMQGVLLGAGLQQKKYDIADMALDFAPRSYDGGKAENSFAADIISADDMPAADRLRRLKTVLAGGYSKIEDGDLLPELAVRRNFPEGVGLFATLGFDLHRNSESLLRVAASEGLTDMCAYLIRDQKADVAVALKVARELGRDKEVQALQPFLADSAVQQPARTPESMSLEIEQLRATVRELTARIEDMRTPDKPLGKPSLPAPKSGI